MTPTPSRRRARRALVAGLVVALLTTPALVASPAVAAPEPAPASDGRHADASGFADGRYIVTLRDDAVATYRGGVGSFARTQPADGEELNARSKRAAAYGEHLAEVQRAVAEDVGAEIATSLTVASNAFTGTLSAQQAADLAADARVSSVVPDELLHLQTALPSTDFLGLSGTDGVWSALGGIPAAGKGVVVGVIDSGIAPENPSFAGEKLGTSSGSEPWRDGERIVFDKADGSRFSGVCQSGEQFDASDCSTKLVGARYFVDSYGADYIGRDRGETVSPRDGNGHGSHTASTAAGNAAVAATVAGRDLGEISGVAPAAKVAMYKACWSGPTQADDGCMTGDLLAAIDAAVADGVDVINYSIGGGGAVSTVALTDQAFLAAATAGIFVAASAGNDGPDASTVDNAAPWITTVAASTIPSYEATVRTGDGRAFAGGSITVAAPLSGPLVAAPAAAADGASDPQLCGPGTLDTEKTAGMIVLCDRGVVDRVAKSAEVARAGGIGMILVNTSPNSIDLDVHSVPTVHVDAPASDALHAYAGTPGATVAFEEDNTTGEPSPATPQLAGFSSRGPVLADGGDVLKPDVTAPGVAILADGRNSEGDEPTFELLSGTSMASPHVAGLAALYLGAHPDASPAEIKSALMTTSRDTVRADGSAYADPFGQGAGQVGATRYLDPGVLFLSGADDWYAYIQGIGAADLGLDPVDPSDLNLPSVSIGALAGVQTVTRTMTAARAGTWSAQPVRMPGVDVTVTPSRLEFGAAGEQKSFQITFRRTDAALDAFTTANLRWSGNGSDAATMPLAVRPTDIAVPATVEANGATASVEIPVLGGQDMTVPIGVSGLTPGRVVRGAGAAGSEPQRHIVDVPEGTSLARFELAGADSASDLDLTLYRVDEFGGLLYLGDAKSPQADETIIRTDVEAGRYVLEVSFFSGAGQIAYDLTSYLVGGDAPQGALRADPAELALSLGETTPLTLSWTDLTPGGRWFGRVTYGSTTASTDLYVTTDGTATPPDVEPALQVAPETVRPGRSFSVEAVGLPAATEYVIALDGTELATGWSTDAGQAARQLFLPADTPEGTHELTLVAGATRLKATLTAAALVVHSIFEIVDYLADGGATVSGEVTFSGNGTVHTTLVTAAGSPVSSEDVEVTIDPMYDVDSARTTPVPVVPGDYVLSAWSDIDGAPGPVSSKAFTVETTQPSSLTLTPHPGDDNAVDLRYDNSVGAITQATIRSKTCAGPLVFGSLWIDKPVIEATFDLTGITGIDVLVDGKVAGSYASSGSERCADHTEVSHDFWAVVAAPDATPAESRAAAPLELTMNNRYPAYSGGFELSAGYGTDIYGDRVFSERIDHPRVLEPGPVVTRETTIDADAEFWIRARYEVLTPDIHLTAHRVVLIPAVSPAELLPVVPPSDGGPGDPGTGTDPGDGGGDGAGAPIAAPGSGDDLANTGGGWAPAVAAAVGTAAVLAVLAGVALVLVRRRRRRA